MATQENTSAAWTYRMEVSPTGQGATPVLTNPNDPIALLHWMVSLQSQSLEMQRQSLELQKHQFELVRETVQFSREQRARHSSELEKWQASHEHVIDQCKTALGQLEQVHSALLNDLTNYVDENLDNLLDLDFSLSDFVDRFGPRLAHVNTMLAVLRPLAAANKKTEEEAVATEK